MIAHATRIESDEDGFHLVIETDEGRQQFRLDDPEALYDAARREIWPWLRERDEARAADMRPPTIDELEEDEGAYDLTDPKHPRHHEVFADLATKEIA